MTLRRIIPLAALAIPLAATAVHAQRNGPSIGIGWGSARLESPGSGFDAPTAAMPMLSVGSAAPGGFLVDIRLSRVRSEVTQRATVPPSDAPYTVGLDATLVEVDIGYRPPAVRLGIVQPRATVGMLWAAVTDRWGSDTPDERRSAAAGGLVAAVGVEAALAPRLALVTQARVRRTAEGDDRPSRHIGLRGAALEAALHLGF